jgi:hypothetical protein
MGWRPVEPLGTVRAGRGPHSRSARINQIISMTVARYSLSHLFAVVTAVAVAVVFCVDWRSRGGEQQALERLLVFACISSLVITYWKFSASGWRRVFQAALVTSLVWTACVVSTHLMFMSSMRKYRIGLWDLLLRIVLVIGVGIAAAVLGGIVIHLVVCAGQRRWSRPSRRSLVWTILVCAGLVLLAAVVTSAVRDGDWSPSVVSDQEQPRAVSHATEKVRSKFPFHLAIVSPCKRLIVGLNGPHLFVVDADTLDLVMQFEGPETGGFVTATFFPDGNTLVVVYVERGGRTSLLRWRTSDWAMQESIPLSDLVDSERLASTFPILADHMLLLVHLTEDEGESSRLDISTIALNGGDWEPVAFASMNVPDVSWATLRSPLHQSWSVSPDGSCIVSGSVLGQGRRWIIRRGAETPLRTDGDFLGFLPHGATAVVAEASEGVSVRVHVSSERPPFWDHFRRSGFLYRVSLVDCVTGELLLRSRWWSCSSPYLSESRLFIVASSPLQDGAFLIWDTTMRRP